MKNSIMNTGKKFLVAATFGLIFASVPQAYSASAAEYALILAAMNHDVEVPTDVVARGGHVTVTTSFINTDTGARGETSEDCLILPPSGELPYVLGCIQNPSATATTRSRISTGKKINSASDDAATYTPPSTSTTTSTSLTK